MPNIFCCNSISVSEISYSVEMSDLKNYLSDVGTIYFVVLITDSGLKLDSALGVLQILKHKLLLIGLSNKEDSHKTDIYDFFQLNGGVYIIEDGRQKSMSHFAKLEKKDYLTYSNVRYSTIFPSFQMYDPHENPKLVEGANKVLLDLLLVFDECKKTEVLQTAKDLAEWILQTNDNTAPTEIYQLNLLQTVKRERELTKEEKNLLKSIALNNSNCNEILFGSHLLLGNYELAEEYFGRMEAKSQKELKELPIYQFLKNLKLK